MTTPRRDIVVVGCGGMGRETMDLIEAGVSDEQCWHPIGFVDDAAGALAAEVAGFPVLGALDWLYDHDCAVAVGIGPPAVRARVVDRLRAMGCRTFPTLRHPAASVGRRVDIGDGCLVMAHATLTADISVGQFVIINVGASVSHDTVARDFATMAPGVHLAGATVVGEGVDIGVGAVTIPGVSLGQWGVIGAGAVVTGSTPANAVVVGVPGRITKQRTNRWHELPPERSER